MPPRPDKKLELDVVHRQEPAVGADNQRCVGGVKLHAGDDTHLGRDVKAPRLTLRPNVDSDVQATSTRSPHAATTTTVS